MTLKRTFENITGMWKRRKTVGGKTETHFYGQIRETITLNAGDKVHMYETRAKDRTAKSPQYHLKVLRAEDES
tara:strand:+ start:22182 stop:22400 length:219 start_codon:yes stop_codon:yes gene_type:complete